MTYKFPPNDSQMSFQMTLITPTHDVIQLFQHLDHHSFAASFTIQELS